MKKAVLLLPFLSLAILSHSQEQRHSLKSKTPAVLTDPFFDIPYNPSKIHYDPVPQSFVSVCHHTFQHEFVYAYLKSGDAEYFVISGYSSDQDGDSLGYVAIVRGSRCDSADLKNTFVGVPPQGGYSNPGTDERIPGEHAQDVRDPGESGAMGNSHYVLRSRHDEAILRGLLEDNFRRGIRAFGGEVQYKSLICTTKMMKGFSDYADVITEQELKSFCSRSPSVVGSADDNRKGK
jgi:hypothetical protein